MESNPYILHMMNRLKRFKNQFIITFVNTNFPNEEFSYIYKYGPNERIHFYERDGFMTPVTVNVATWLREAMNHVFNEVD